MRHLVDKTVVVILVFIVFGISINSEISYPLSNNQIVAYIDSNNTLYVGGSGPNNYSSIQNAINDSQDGYTIFVYDDSSPYYENIIINISVVLVGENKMSTVIHGRGKDVIIVTADNIVISNFTIRGSTFLGYGIYVTDSDAITIDNSILVDNGCCLCIRNCSYAYVSNNIISSGIPEIESPTGIVLGECYGCTLRENTISLNLQGLIVVYSEYNSITKNNIIQNLAGIELMGANHNDISSNNISQNEIGLFLDFGRLNNVNYNNFIDNSRWHVWGWSIFDAKKNDWNRNYWDNWPGIIPKPIWSSIFLPPPIPVIATFDWCPLVFPYEW